MPSPELEFSLFPLAAASPSLLVLHSATPRGPRDLRNGPRRKKQDDSLVSQECRSRHLKCDGRKPVCRRCEQSQASCVWGLPKIRFRHGSSAKYDADFAADQTWLNSAQEVDYKYVDETAEIASCYTTGTTQYAPLPWVSSRIHSLSSASIQPSISDSYSTNQETLSHFTENSPSSPRQQRHFDQEKEYDQQSLQVSTADGYSITPLSPLHPQSHFRLLELKEGTSGLNEQHRRVLPPPSLDLQEASLLRYFVLQLAHCFDLCDSERHFALTVPLRAMSSATLLNAIYTTSARHISRIKKYYVGGQIKFQNNILPNLTPESALFYHNRCIQHLVSLSDDPMEVNDENLLAATVILRFYEEVDIPTVGEDNENALKGIRLFLNPDSISATEGTSLRRAAYWIALRQEILTAFSKQRPLRLSLEPCRSYRTFQPVDDCGWANRLILHCAYVIQYCFGTEKEGPGQDSTEYTTITPRILLSLEGNDMPMLDAGTAPPDRFKLYDDLIEFEALWAYMAPPSFSPIHSREPDREQGKVFPEYWYLNNCHVTGIQHLELARILLAVHNPRLPRLGVSHRIAMTSADRDVKAAVLRLCGMGLSNPHCPPTLVTAGVAIGMCGDKFSDRVEQEALAGVLSKLEDEHGWPTEQMRISLTQAWHWDGNNHTALS
ncbi:uncharacterized protein TRUGW13939_09974 [Talaromyces rugulosus]|uniref:Zn(2)-C6 fungal-type domain-containing protein n=1 Tax=Talaromyces rugulosus TaxID=121627 RepID=A0A7H8R8S5_TALRU|nr:uncharacterized protein TRUGW13939_09974 [Talaromyces rugulosus]QKX62809.1 hypothetical protein TRUGW13939_09974 [Talaromyces rugulosus]